MTSTFPNHQSPMASWVGELTRLWEQRWWSLPEGLPDLGPTYTLRDKLDHEDVLGHFVDDLLGETAHPPRSEVERAALQQRLLDGARGVAIETLDLDERALDVLEEAGFYAAAGEFIKAARRFDPALSGEDIYQASRNVWTMNLIQFLLGLAVRVTPAVLAYSLLYPYSDNLLDDPALSPAAKLAFNRRFACRLTGELLDPGSPTEQKVFDLVAMVEDQYPRADFPQVYASLLAIHGAQDRSLRLLGRNASPYELDVLGISFEKGGTAVLADGYLVAGDLSPAQRDFLFGYGAFTQLMDDQEDLPADRQARRLTVFSQTAQDWRLDGLTSRLFRLGDRVMEAMEGFDRPGVRPVCAMISRSIHLLLGTAACRMPAVYTRPYLHQVEAHLPFRIAFIERQRRRLERHQAALSRLLE